MKKNRFFLLVAFALFAFLPFSVNALTTNEVIDKYEDVVYVIEESEYQDVLSSCDSNLTYNIDTVAFIPESKIGTIIVFEYDDGTTEEIFTYDFATGSCQKGLDTYYLEHYYDLREAYYYPSDGKLYKEEIHPLIKSGYLQVAWENIEMDQKIYYTKHTAWLFYEVDDNSVCENEQCYRKMDAIELYSSSQIQNNVTYYTFNSSQGEFTTVVDNSTCESHACYHEVNIDDYYTKDSIADMDETKFDLADDGLDIGNDIEIIDYFEFNGIGHIVVEDSNGAYLYNLDGEMILPVSDVYTINDMVVAENKYLINITYHNDVSFKVTIYDNKYNIIYEKNYDHSGMVKEGENYQYFSTIGNSSLFNKMYMKDDSTSSVEEKFLLFTIRDYRLLEGTNQTFADNDLTFKTNGDLKRLDKIFVDNEEITNYTKSEGSTIITLNKDYLNTLENGTHTLKITYGDGGYVETTFNVSKTTSSETISSETTTPPTEIENPDTSDPIASSLFMGIMSLFGLAGTTIYLKRKII